MHEQDAVMKLNMFFLPGASGNTAFWQAVIKRLPQVYEKTVIAYPSFGGHPDHVAVQSFQALQNYVLEHMSEPSIVVAQSMGGIFAVQAALQKPQHIKALVLVATSGGIDLTRFDVADWREDYQQTFSVPDWFVQHQSHLDDSLDQITCPVLLIWGDADPISPVKVGQYLQSKIVNSELHIIENGQHDLAEVYSDQVAKLIQDFLIKHSL